MKLAALLNLCSAGTVFVGAGFWFASALGSLPPLRMYWNEAPRGDPLFAALEFSARMNRYAAIAAGISALLFGLAIIASWRRSR